MRAQDLHWYLSLVLMRACHPNVNVGKHHNTYIVNLNKLITGTALESASLEDVRLPLPHLVLPRSFDTHALQI